MRVCRCSTQTLCALLEFLGHVASLGRTVRSSCRRSLTISEGFSLGIQKLRHVGMGHKSIQMTLRYLKVAQPDLQQEFYRARQNSPQSYSLPSLSVSMASPDLPGIRQAVAATRPLLEMYRRQFSDDKTRRRLQRLDHRLLTIAQQLENISAPEK
jgi:hypothetical protein